MIRSMILMLGVMAVGTQAAWTADWPHFMGPNRDNTAADAEIAKSFPEDGPKVKWRRDVHEGYGGAAIVGDEVFTVDRVQGEKDVLLCLSKEDGSERWRWELEVEGRLSHPGSRGVPTVTEDAVYGASGFGYIYCIDRETHEPRWITHVPEALGIETPYFGYSIHPLLKGDVVYIAPMGEEVGMAALSRETGEFIWKSEGCGEGNSSPVLVELAGREMLVLTTSDPGNAAYVTAVDPENGEPLFRYEEPLKKGIHTIIAGIKVLSDDTFVMTANYHQGSTFVRVEESGGTYTATKIGHNPSGAMIFQPLRVGDRLYLTVVKAIRGPDQSPRGLVCLDLEGTCCGTRRRNPGLGRGA